MEDQQMVGITTYYPVIRCRTAGCNSRFALIRLLPSYASEDPPSQPFVQERACYCPFCGKPIPADPSQE